MMATPLRVLLLATVLMSRVGLAPVVTAAERWAGEAAVVTEFIQVQRGDATLLVEIQSPAAGRLAARPLLLLNLSGDRQSSLKDGSLGEPARVFLSEGHRVATFDLPAHGERIDRRGSGIDGLRERFIAGDDPFALVIADGKAVIDELLRRGLMETGRVLVCGVSRAGYCAIRLAAADARISSVAALAPVTDWRELREFAAVKDRADVAALTLDHFVEPLVGRRLYVTIGNADIRVSTAACTRFVFALNAAEQRRALTSSQLRYDLVDDTVGHALATRWRQEGARFLLRTGQSAEPTARP
ncbi:alpha/beta hydrolase family protein [Horticoccus sp. 23ND18S-11]|uniref:alpha/beta hydrolase family protein n=1 Tax=Horticoccus sp. 23ND18S-11 TaxID=3391832 RepID=UPI0039C9F13F